MLPEIELDQSIQEDIEQSKKKRFILNSRTICSAQPNSLNITNNEESYKNYFSMGGTVRKMSMASSKNYMRFKRKRLIERLEIEDPKAAAILKGRRF